MQHDSADRCEGITDRFTRHLATDSAPLRDLCKTNVPYDWEPEHDAAFSNLKKAISSNEVLRYYDSTKTLVIQVDASQRGLGSALLQANCPSHSPVSH